MTQIQRQRVVWSGFKGGPGLSTFYFTDAASSQAALHDFFTGMLGSIPPDVHLHIEPGGDVLDDTNGTLLGVWAGTLQADMQGGAPDAPYAGPADCLVR